MTRSAVPLALALIAIVGLASAQTSNGGDPLFCQPNEGTTFLIVNGGGGIFTVDPDCYANFIGPARPPGPTIATSRGGTLTLNLTARGGNYTYAPPTPDFVGLDTFQIGVTTTWNATGGPGSNTGTFLSRPGGPDTVTVTLNVLPATLQLQAVAGAAKLLPIPAGSVTGCGPQGNAGQGPANGVIAGCVTALGLGPFRSPSSIATAHGAVAATGNTVRYTPTAGYSGPDSFVVHIFGTNTDGPSALDAGTNQPAGPLPAPGNTTVQITVGPSLVITNTSTLPNGTTETAYTPQTFAATGGFPLGSPTYTFSLASGTLPPGLTLTNGVLSGTPTTAGIFNFSVQVADGATDGGPNTATQAFQLTVVSASVPALSTWGLALLAGLLLLLGTRLVARNRAHV